MIALGLFEPYNLNLANQNRNVHVVEWLARNKTKSQ